MGTLRPYQAELLERTRDAFRHGYRRPCIVLGCGGGKSCIAAEIALGAAQKGGRVLFLVHRIELCEQIRRTFFDWGVPMSAADVLMVQTASRRAAGGKIRTPSIIITDENHHCLAASYRAIYEAFPNTPCVGITATPCRLNGGGLGDVNDVLVEGPSTKWMIEHEYLAPFDYYAPTIADLTGLHTRSGEYIASEIAQRLDTPAIRGDVIESYRRRAGGQSAIVYCASRSHSESTAQAFRDAGIPAAHIDGETPPRERSAAVDAFRSGRLKILSNVDLISEGFDVPDCSCAILLRPTKSLTLYIQQSMRCMRYRPGKRAVILDHVGNYARFGLPDAERTWTLEPAKQSNRVQAEPAPHMCPYCFGTFRAYTAEHACPYCRSVIPVKERSVEEIESAHLERVEGFTLHYDSPGQCRSFEELRAYGRRKGYKPGWAWYQAKARGLA